MVDSAHAHAHAHGRVLVTWLDFDAEDPQSGGLLTEAGLTLDMAPKWGERTPEEVRDLAAGSVAAIVSTDPFDRAVFAGVPTLRAVCRVGVGTDSIDIDAATEAGVAVAITAGANADTTADHTVALLLAAVRRVIENDASVRRGEWERAGPLTPWDLHGRTVGIIGLGDIGRRVAKRLAGFGVTIIASDPATAPPDGIELVTIDELLGRAHIVSLHAPLVAATRGLIGARELGLMGPDAILVNTSRGGLVDQDALVVALDEGAIRAAALDVFADEPPKSRQLFGSNRVVLSPHIGGLSDVSIQQMTRQAARNVLDILAGRATPAVINPQALEAADGERPDGGRG
jgi:phosphoglycerate dehydrogenase-like enzyme